MKMTVYGRLTAAEDRKLRGMLLPFGEVGRTNLGRVVARPGRVTVPTDPAALAALHASLDHLDGKDSVAQFASIQETDAGLIAEWDVPSTHGGDKLLAEYKAGKRTGVSVELEPVKVKDGELVSGVLIGCAFPEDPAFPSARLVAELAPDTPECDREGCDVVGEHEHRPAEDDPQDPPADDPNPNDDPAATADPENPTQEGNPMTAAANRRRPVAPAELLTASSPQKRRELVETPGDFFRLLAAAQNDRRLMAALSDVTPATIGDMDVPQWVGKMWEGAAYTRRIVPLLGSDTLTSMTIEGWRWATKPKMGRYAGNKAEIPSGPVTTEPVSFPAGRYAGGHDIDRQYIDFPSPKFWEGYYAAMTESYGKLTDEDALADLKAAATVVAPGSVPSGIAPEWAALVDAALAIVDRAVPTFAVVEKSVYRAMILTPKDQVLEFLNAALSLEEGQLSGFRVVPVAADTVNGGLDAGEILVGARQAATFHELGGGAPIRVEALDVNRAGVDAGVFGYGGTVIHDDTALAIADLSPTDV